MNSMIYKKKSPLFLFLIPAFAFMTVYLYYPFVMNIYNSFCKIRALGTASKGFNDPLYENYTKLFTDAAMGTAFKNTMLLMLCTIIFQVGIALLLALLIDNITVGTKFFRTVYFFPIVISAGALGLLFNLLFLYPSQGVSSVGGGPINTIVGALTGQNGPAMIDWKSMENWMFTMFLPIMWQYVGFYFVIIITGLNNISADIYEAASIDGADGMKRIRYITLPLLHNTLCTCLTLAITGALKVFDLPWVMFPNGVPLGQSWLTGTYMYSVTYGGDVDYGSTIALLIVVLGVVISQVANIIFKEKDY
ncbi:MAG: sugar ABC transporter permease [Oscillospiraceae bacterium]|nr:sugar ABC transporter permease [Oscillospiraceae bacterium]